MSALLLADIVVFVLVWRKVSMPEVRAQMRRDDVAWAARHKRRTSR